MKTREIVIRSHSKLRRLQVLDHGIPLGVAAITPQDTVESMLAAFSMTKQRCYNERCRDYGYYGGRGITIDGRWLEDPLNLVIDMGLRPEGYTLERVDNNGPYSRENCRWATRGDQMSNTRSVVLVEYAGECLTIAEWERRLAFKPGTLKARLTRLGYSVEEAMTKEVKCGGLLPGKTYPHLVDNSWRNTSKLAPRKPKFSGETVEEIRNLASLGVSRSEIAKRFSTSVTTISNVVDRLKGYKDA